MHATYLYSQEIDFNPILEGFSKSDFSEVQATLEQIDTLKCTDYDKATWLFYHALYHFEIDQHHIAYQSILKGKQKFRLLKKDKDVTDCNMLLIDILSHQNNLKTNIEAVINELTSYALEKKDTTVLLDTYRALVNKSIDLDNRKEALNYINKIIAIAKIQKDTFQLANNYMNIGTVFISTDPINNDSALYYTHKATPVYKKYNDNRHLSYNYNNLGNIYKENGDYKKAIYYFKKADSVPLQKFFAKTKVVYYKNMADAFSKSKEYNKATIYLKKQIALQDSINDTQQNIAITGIKEKYDNEKLRADNLVSEAKRIKNKNYLYAALGLLAFGLITGFLIYKNIIRKKRIAEKDQQLAKQKVTNLLKEQELLAIDAMIEGQEKERQLIASDLHDDLGALMATLQLNFENLDKHKNSEDSNVLFARTKSLISEAYQKIRKIAHAKNSGVIAKQGLLKAIKNNAHKISQLNDIDIDVREHGLENRLENSLELTIFRIVQELITNIIKHADASQVTIHFTNHEGLLNIMVEDNGKGFDTKSISKSKGMGIHSIEKRIESFEGTMTIESIIGKGTTIILDIPI